MSVADIYGKGKVVIMRDDHRVDTDVTNGGDFRKVDGKTNLINRIILRLSIRKGELETDPEVGSELFDITGLPLSPLSFAWARTLIYDALIKDPAIDDIEDLMVTEDPSRKGWINIVGNIISVTEYMQMIDEPHDYTIGQDIYELNKEHVRVIIEVKGIVNENLVFFIQNQDYIQVGDSIEFIGDVKPNGGFLVTYQFYNVTESQKQVIPFNTPFNLSS